MRRLVMVVTSGGESESVIVDTDTEGVVILELPGGGYVERTRRSFVPRLSGMHLRVRCDQRQHPEDQDLVVRRRAVRLVQQLDVPTGAGLTIENSYFAEGFPSCATSLFTSRYNVTDSGSPCGTGSQVFSSASINAGFISPIVFSNRPSNVPAAPGDWHIKTTSPLKDIGGSAFAPLVDFDGVTRPVGVGPDVGAFEFTP